MVHHGAQLRNVGCGSRNGIVCVEWTEPVDVIDAMRGARVAGRAANDPVVYLIERDGVPVYCGCTRRNVGERLQSHWYDQSMIGRLLQSVIWSEIPTTVRWAAGDEALEAYVIRSLLPSCNHVHAVKHRISAQRAGDRRKRIDTRPKLTAEQRREIARRVDAGEKKIRLAAEYGVAPSSIDAAWFANRRAA